MHTTGTISDVQFGFGGKVFITFELNERKKVLKELDSLKDKRLTIDAEPYKSHRSGDANRYFWQLVDKIAKVLGMDKWVVYLYQLSKYGVFVDVAIRKDAMQTLVDHFRYTEVLQEGDEYNEVRCFYGSSCYDSKEMSDLINGTVEDASALGISTITPDEIAHMISAMKEGKNESKCDCTQAY